MCEFRIYFWNVYALCTSNWSPLWMLYNNASSSLKHHAGWSMNADFINCVCMLIRMHHAGSSMNAFNYWCCIYVAFVIFSGWRTRLQKELQTLTRVHLGRERALRRSRLSKQVRCIMHAFLKLVLCLVKFLNFLHMHATKRTSESPKGTPKKQNVQPCERVTRLDVGISPMDSIKVLL